jgi:uncharacterized phage protein gp47/JayE
MYEAPSVDSLSKDIRKDMAAEIPGAEPWHWPNNLYVISKVIALKMRAVLLRLQELHKQAFVSLAEGDYLDLHAADKATSRGSATLAAGSVTITGDADTTIAAGTRLLRLDGIAYQLVADATIPVTTVTASIVAEEPGKAANAIPDTPLSLETPVDEVTSIVVDDTGITGGEDVESDASLRERLLDLERNPPHGGSPGEYIRWVRENKPGVTRVFVQRATPEAGHVTIVFMMDDTYEDGLPTASDVDDVVAILETNAPGDAEIHVYAPTLIAVDVDVADILPDTPAVHAAVQNELEAVFRRRAEPGSSRADFTFYRSWLDEAISNAAGEDSHTLSAPAADIVLGVDTQGVPELAVLGTVSFV